MSNDASYKQILADVRKGEWVVRANPRIYWCLPVPEFFYSKTGANVFLLIHSIFYEVTGDNWRPH